MFIDFKREPLGLKDGLTPPTSCRGSLFSHQELAIAAYLKMPVAAFREEGVKDDDGILRFLQTNAKPFSDRGLLPDLVRDGIAAQGWVPTHRNELILERIQTGEHFDHLANCGQLRRFYRIDVCNLHLHKIATGCYAYLEKAAALSPTRRELSFKPVELKWAGYTLPNVSLMPQKIRSF